MSLSESRSVNASREDSREEVTVRMPQGKLIVWNDLTIMKGKTGRIKVSQGKQINCSGRIKVGKCLKKSLSVTIKSLSELKKSLSESMGQE